MSPPQALRGARVERGGGDSPSPPGAESGARSLSPLFLSGGGSVLEPRPGRAGRGQRTHAPHGAARPEQRPGTDTGSGRERHLPSATSPQPPPSRPCPATHTRPGGYAPPQPSDANWRRRLQAWRRNPTALTPRCPGTPALIVSLYGHQNV